MMGKVMISGGKGEPYFSCKRGISSTKLHGLCWLSGWWMSISSQPSLQAFGEPGRAKIYVPSATPAQARLCIVDVAIFWKLIQRNNSPNPGISFSQTDASASGVTSRPVTPVPPVVITTSIWSSAIQVLNKSEYSNDDVVQRLTHILSEMDFKNSGA